MTSQTEIHRSSWILTAWTATQSNKEHQIKSKIWWSKCRAHTLMHADSFLPFVQATLSMSGSAFSSISFPYYCPASAHENLSEMALRACWYSAEVAVSGLPLPMGGGGTMTKRWEEKRGEEEKWGRGEKCVPGVYTASPLCVRRVRLFHFRGSPVDFRTRDKAERFSADGRTQVVHFRVSDCWGWMEAAEGQRLRFGPVWPPFLLHRDASR